MQKKVDKENFNILMKAVSEHLDLLTKINISISTEERNKLQDSMTKLYEARKSLLPDRDNPSYLARQKYMQMVEAKKELSEAQRQHKDFKEIEKLKKKVSEAEKCYKITKEIRNIYQGKSK